MMCEDALNTLYKHMEKGAVSQRSQSTYMSYSG